MRDIAIEYFCVFFAVFKHYLLFGAEQWDWALLNYAWFFFYHWFNASQWEKYYLVHKISGWSDKTETLELFDSKPDFDNCSKSDIEALYAVTIELTQL